MAIYKVDNGFVISSRQVWLPGCYESEKAAKLAFKLPDAALVELRDSVNHAPITYEALLDKYREINNFKRNQVAITSVN